MDFVQLKECPGNIDTIDIQDVIDYSFCNYYYKLKKESSKPVIFEKYDEILYICYLYYLQSIRDKDVTDVKKLSKIWANKWIKKDINNNTYTFNNVSFNDLKDKGAKTLVSFHQIISGTKQYPIAMFKKYIVPITENLKLTGKFDYIREVTHKDNTQIEVLKFLNSKTQTVNNNYLYNDIELTAMSYAFTELFDTNIHNDVMAYIPNKEIIINNRTSQDYERLKQTVISAYLGIKNNLYMYSPSNKCYNCIYKYICREYVEKEN